MKVSNKILWSILIFIKINFNCFSQPGYLLRPEIQVEYSKGLSTNVLLSINNTKGGGSYTYAFNDYTLGVGLNYAQSKIVPELIIGASTCLYFLELGIKGKAGFSKNTYYVLSPNIGLSYFGYCSLSYNFNFNDYSLKYYSRHGLTLKLIIGKWK
jgi:hypothetical protein